LEEAPLSELAFATQFAQAVYQIQPRLIEALPPLFEQRGIFRIHDAHERVWLLRLLHQPQAAAAFAQTAHLLQWLEQQHYPAPRLCRTHHQHLVGHLHGWSSLLLSYIGGTVLEVHSLDFEQLGNTLGRLHTLPLTSISSLPQSRCHPKLFRTQTVRQLAQGLNQVPASCQPLVTALHTSLSQLALYDDELRLTHGDCWYKNAIQTMPGHVVLIDWDCAGLGLPLLDLGYLLLTAHYDLNMPLHVVADEKKIQAIMRGYQSARPIKQGDNMVFLSAIQFALAFHLGEYLATHPDTQEDDWVLQKIQARFDVTPEIARLAMEYLT
jgi:Ser/Thr protein kinase RdoA (MazF antagonist)